MNVVMGSGPGTAPREKGNALLSKNCRIMQISTMTFCVSHPLIPRARCFPSHLHGFGAGAAEDGTAFFEGSAQASQCGEKNDLRKNLKEP